MQLPEKGFYRHYKHNPDKGFNDYVYEVIGIARHSEEKTHLVAYRPLYINTYLAPADFSVRPLDMFVEHVEVDGRSLPRFERITDAKLIAELEHMRDEMYGKDALN